MVGFFGIDSDKAPAPAPGGPPRPQHQRPDGKSSQADSDGDDGDDDVGETWERSSLEEVLCGDDIEHDVRLRDILLREQFLLSVIIPRVRTVSDAFREWFRRTMHPLVIVPLILVFIVHIGAMIMCSSDPASDVCAGGPGIDHEDGDSPEMEMRRDWASHAFIEYGPSLINALATLMLSFYANVCMGLYKEGYFACQALKESVLDITAVVVGTIPPQMRELRMEFWRVVNLYHLCAYVLADKTRQTYNLDNFLLPVATAYGDYDGRDKFGMLTADELGVLASDPAAIMSRRQFHRADGRAVWAMRAESRRDTKVLDKERHALEKEKTRAKRKPPPHKGSSGKAWEAAAQTATPEAVAPSAPGAPAPAMPAWMSSKGLINSRGDVTSNTAMLHAALGVRMYMLVDLALEEKLSRAAWPVWNALCLKLRTSTEALKQRALFRLPRIYQASVRFLVSCALLTDTFLLASHAARLVRHGRTDGAWLGHAWFGALLDVALNLTLTWCLSVFLNAISDMQNPFGSETLDMPGLSYVCASSEMSLRMVLGGHAASGTGRSMRATGPNRLFRLLNRQLDRGRMLSGLQAMAEGLPRGPRKRELSRRSRQDVDEDEDGGDE